MLHMKATEEESRINCSLLKKHGSWFHSKAWLIISLANRQTLTPTVYKKLGWEINLFEIKLNISFYLKDKSLLSTKHTIKSKGKVRVPEC